jgi:hypothetical protein
VPAVRLNHMRRSDPIRTTSTRTEGPSLEYPFPRLATYTSQLHSLPVTSRPSSHLRDQSSILLSTIEKNTKNGVCIYNGSLPQNQSKHPALMRPTAILYLTIRGCKLHCSCDRSMDAMMPQREPPNQPDTVLYASEKGKGKDPKGLPMRKGDRHIEEEQT